MWVDVILSCQNLVATLVTSGNHTLLQEIVTVDKLLVQADQKLATILRVKQVI